MGDNSVVAFHKLRIERNSVRLLLLVIGLAILSFLLKESIKHLVWITDGKIGNYSAFFYTLMIVVIVAMIGLLALFIVLMIFFIKSINIIKYYKTAEITDIQRVTLDFDYKLWQTAPKGTFHAMTLTMKIDGEEKSFLSDIIFTNNTKIGLFKIPLILVSKSYVKDSCVIGYDKANAKAIVLSIEKE